MPSRSNFRRHASPPPWRKLWFAVATLAVALVAVSSALVGAGGDGPRLLSPSEETGRLSTAIGVAVGVAQFPARQAPPEETAAVPTSPEDVVRGRVVDWSGHGVAGVVVGDALEGVTGGATATSGDNGAFCLPGATGLTRLIARDARWETVRAALPRLRGVVEIVVAERIALQGLVVDAGGMPIGGAMLAVVPPVGGATEGVPRRWLTFSAGDGTFSFAAVPALASARMLTQHPGMLADDRPLPVTGPHGVVVQLRAEPAIDAIVGTVFGPDGMPHAGATVHLGEAVTTTGSGGTFELAPRCLPAGELPLYVQAAGCTPMQVLIRSEAGRAPAPLTVLLRPAVAIRGRIVDAAGVPQRDWIVTLADPTLLRPGSGESCVEGQLGAARVVTDADGAFCFANVFERAYTLEAWAFAGGGALRARVSPGEGLVTLRRVEQPECRRRGVVLDEHGQPVVGAIVGEARLGCMQAGALGMRFDERATTDAAGRFTLAHGSAALHLLVDGPDIVPARFAIDATFTPDAIATVHVRRRCSLRCANAAAAAIAFASADAAGCYRAEQAGADSFVAVANARELVVHHHGVPVGTLLLRGLRDLELCVQGATLGRTGP